MVSSNKRESRLVSFAVQSDVSETHRAQRHRIFFSLSTRNVVALVVRLRPATSAQSCWQRTLNSRDPPVPETPSLPACSAASYLEAPSCGINSSVKVKSTGLLVDAGSFGEDTAKRFDEANTDFARPFRRSNWGLVRSSTVNPSIASNFFHSKRKRAAKNIKQETL